MRSSLIVFLFLMCCRLDLAWAQTDAPAKTTVLDGRLESGASYRIEVPDKWSGRVLLYSRGYSSSHQGPVRVTAGKERDQLLAQGYALVAASYSRPGWALEEAVPDQLAVLDVFASRIGQPKQVIAWGSSMGGLITVALLEQHGQRFHGGMALCASSSGTLGMMNTALDGAWVFANVTGAGATLPVRLTQTGTEDQQQRTAWREAIDAAQANPLGRARIALAASLSQTPVWAAGQARPQPGDVHAVQAGWKANFLAGILLPRDNQERRAGGNFSWNTQVRYGELLRQSGHMEIVRQLYAQAGHSLDSDLAALEQAPRISADPAAVAYMFKHYVPTGRIDHPVLLMQTVSDPLTLTEFTEDYATTVQSQGRQPLVQTAYVERVGHCNFTADEVLAGLKALQSRIAQGQWEASAAALNATSGGQTFVTHKPQALLRSCSRSPRGCEGVRP